MIEDLDFIVVPYFRGIEIDKNETEMFELHESIEMLIDKFIEFYDINNNIKIIYQFNILNLFGNWLCKKGYTNFSWFLLCWMFIFTLILLIGLFITINNALKNSDFVNLIKAEINKKKLM